MEENPPSPPPPPPKQDPAPEPPKSTWGGWGISVFSDLQKAAAAAAEEISRNAVTAVKNAAKGIEEMPSAGPDPKPGKEDGKDERPSGDDEAIEMEEDRRRKLALEKLENASEDSILGQGLKVIDNSVESFASGAWQVLGNAFRGSSILVHKLENSAANFADSIQQGGLPVNSGSIAPSLLETGKTFTVKGMQVLERVGKETMELLITETGIEIENSPKEAHEEPNDEQSSEDVTFDRCFYIYGGPELLEELEALSSHYALLFNRRKAKLSSEQKSFYDGKLKEVQQIFSLNTQIEGDSVDSDKGKNIETVEDGSGSEMKVMRDSSVSKAADMAAGFTAAIGGLAAGDIIQRTADRLETVHSEGVHRLSELCCCAVSQLLMMGKSIISSSNKSQDEDGEVDDMKIDWPEDSILKAKIIRAKAQSMTGDVEAVSNSFITGISDVVEAYLTTIKGASKNADSPRKTSIQDKANAISGHLESDGAMSVGKIQDGLQYLAFVLVSTSMPSS